MGQAAGLHTFLAVDGGVTGPKRFKHFSEQKAAGHVVFHDEYSHHDVSPARKRFFCSM
jgi:hypothetical protein